MAINENIEELTNRKELDNGMYLLMNLRVMIESPKDLKSI